jgi:hypothetical protein
MTTLLTTGLVCLIAAIIGGGLKAFGIEIPALQSAWQRNLLGALGLVLLFAAYRASLPDTSNTPLSKTQATPAAATALSETQATPAAATALSETQATPAATPTPLKHRNPFLDYVPPPAAATALSETQATPAATPTPLKHRNPFLDYVPPPFRPQFQ